MFRSTLACPAFASACRPTRPTFASTKTVRYVAPYLPSPARRPLALQDPLRQAVDRASNLPADPNHPTAASLTPSQIGTFIGGFLGGTLGALTGNQTVSRAGTGIGGLVGSILGGEYGNGNAQKAISTVNDSGLAGAPGAGM
jgi:hypothetical protein